MKRQVFRIAIVGLLFSSPIGYASAAEEQVKQFLSGVIGIIGNKIVEDIGRGFDKREENLRRERQRREATFSGYCQVWRYGKLSVQKPCTSRQVCDNRGACTRYYRWPTGGQTEVFSRNGQPISLNGKPTVLVDILGHPCLTDGRDTHLFCYTTVPQRANVPSTAPDAPVGGKKDNGQPAKTIAAPPKPNLDTLLEEYIAVSESLSDSSATQRRCDLGIELTGDHSDELGSELQALILEQLEADKCLTAIPSPRAGVRIDTTYVIRPTCRAFRCVRFFGAKPSNTTTCVEKGSFITWKATPNELYCAECADQKINLTADCRKKTAGTLPKPKGIEDPKFTSGTLCILGKCR